MHTFHSYLDSQGLRNFVTKNYREPYDRYLKHQTDQHLYNLEMDPSIAGAPQNITHTYIDDQCFDKGQDQVCQSKRLHYGTLGIVLSNYSGSSQNVRSCGRVRVRFGSQTYAGLFFRVL